jgi:UDP-N-acetylglucosamine 3-dehydrogenase
VTTEAPRPLRVAVIGCGSTAHRRHLPVWQGLAGARLVAVCSRDPGRRLDAQRRYGAERAVADWRELLDAPDVDAVDLCVPHPHHAELACAFARAGKHVLCEKPLARSLAEAEEMARAAREAGVVLLPFHNMRLGGAAARAVELVRSGRLGQLRIVRAVMAHGGPEAADPARRWFLEAAAGGGALLDLGPHLFDLVAAVVGDQATRLRATLARTPDMAVERDALVEIEFAGGTLATVTASWSMAAGRETSLVVHGEHGTLRLWLLHIPPASPAGSVPPLALAWRHGATATVEYPEPAADQEPCAVFLRAVRGEPVPLTLEDGLRTMRWCDAAYRSAAEGGRWLPL